MSHDLTRYSVVGVGTVAALAGGLDLLARGRTGTIPTSEVLDLLAAHGVHVRTAAASTADTHVVLVGGRDEIAVRMGHDDARGLVDVLTRAAPDRPATVVALAPAEAATTLLGLARDADLARNTAALAAQGSDQAHQRLAAHLTTVAHAAAGEPDLDTTQHLERAS